MEGADELGLRGAVLEGQYRIDGVSQSSPLLVGYDAHDVGRDLPVHVKVVRPLSGLGPADVHALGERLRLDGAGAHHLGNDTPHVRRVLSAGAFPAHGAMLSYRVGERLRGVTLLEDIGARGPRDVQEAMALLDPVFLALVAATERSLVHAEVSPHAVVLEPTPQQGVLAKLDDGGIARTLTAFAWEKGLPGPLEGRTFDALFAAPEFFRDGQLSLSPLVDIHGLAVTLLSVLVGRPPRTTATARSLASVPYQAETILGMGARVDDAFATVLARALSPDPTERPQTLASFWESLKLALSLGAVSGGFTAKGTKVLPTANALPMRAGTIPMVKHEPLLIVESTSAVGAKKDPFKIDPFAQTFGVDASRPGVSPLASTVPPGKGPQAADIIAAMPSSSAAGASYPPHGGPGAYAAVPHGAPGAGHGAPHASPSVSPPPMQQGLGPPSLSGARPPAYSEGQDEGTPVWVWIVLPIAGLAILALVAFIVALVLGWDPKFL